MEDYGPWGGSGPASVFVRFDDSPEELEKIVLHHGAASVLTAGIYRFWMKTWLRRVIWSKISVESDPLEYTGTPVELLLGTLIAVTILAVYLMIFNLAISVASLALWQAGVFNISVFLSLLVSLPLIQFAIYRARRYRLLRTRWRGIRFGMDGSALRFVGVWAVWMLVTTLTLGLAYPWMRTARERYMTDHMMFGDARFRFDGDANSLMRDYLPLWLISLAPVLVLAIAVGSQMIFGRFQLGSWALLTPVYIYVVFWFYCRYRAAEYRMFFAARKICNVETTCVFGATGLINPAWAYVGRSIIPGALPVGLIISAVTAIVLYFASLAGGGDASVAWSLENVIFANYDGVLSKGILIIAFWFNYGASIILILWLWTVVYYRRFLSNLCGSLTLTGVESLSRVRQRTEDDQIDSEGFADALDVGGL